MDFLNLGTNASVRKMLGKEEVKFSGKVIKINNKGKKQNRVLLISDSAMYNLDEKYKCKRRIELNQLAGLTESKSSDEFVVHVPSTYDYHFSSTNAVQIREVLVAAFQIMCEAKNEQKPFPIVVTEESDLSINVVTQDIAKRTEEGKKNPSKFVDYVPGDHLKLADHPLVQEKLGIEKLIMSLKTIKINRKLKNQERVLLVSDKAIYNFSPSLEFNRRIVLEHVTALTTSKQSEQLVIHVPMEYDYHFSSSKNTEVAKVLQSLAEKSSRTLVLTEADEADLSSLVLTKELAQLQTTAEKQDRREALSAPKTKPKRGSKMGPETNLHATVAKKAPLAPAVVNDTNFEVDDDGDG